MNQLEIKDVFEKLNIPNWRITGQIAGGTTGQAIVTEVTRISDNTKGVFRVLNLKKRKEIDIKRFIREIKILCTEKYRHPNVINILDYSENDLWYISEKGIPFTQYWNDFRVKYSNNQDIIVETAISHLIKIISGLIPLHLEKVVHRDIKPDNIVIVKEQPVLIDFGLVFDPAEERITQLDSAVGNARFSPDQMMNRQEDVLPWLDVFQLSQLLIWMVSDKPTKTWSRPLDWRWVIYPQEMKDTHVLSIKAITAICSDPSTSPSDAMELNKLISNLINFDYSISHTDPSVNEIIETVKSAKAKSVLNSSSDLSLFNSTFPIFEKFYYQFESHVKELAKLGSNILPIKLEEKEKFEHWADNVKKTKKFTSHSANYPYDLRCGEVNSGNFWLTTVNIFYVPSQLEEKSGTDYLPDGFLPLAFHFGIGSNKDALQRMHPRRLFIGIDKTGKLWYSDDSGNFKSSRQETSVKEICDLLTSWIKHSGSWEIINT